MTPPSAGGEMWRSFANRVYDMICPGGSFQAPWELWHKTGRKPRLPTETGQEEYKLIFGRSTPPQWSNWSHKQLSEMRRHGRLTDVGSHR